MNDLEFQEFQSAGRMVDVMATNDNIFKDYVKAMELKTALIADIDILEAAGARRVSASGMRSDGTMDKRAARTTLEEFVRKIAANGKIIKKAEPDFDNKFTLRRGKFNSQELLDTARAFKFDLTAAAAKFADYGFVAATPLNMQNKIDAFEAGSAQQNAGKGGTIAATAETRAAIKRLKVNRRTLKTIGENILDDHGDAGLKAEWKSACKIDKHRSTPTPTPPTT